MSELPFDKYDYYLRAVQSPEVDVNLFTEIYEELKGQTPLTLREDFCGTFSLCQEWVKLNPENKAFGVDLDPEPIAYGHQQMKKELNDEQQTRVQVLTQDVFDISAPTADIVVALNFSYFIIKEREKLRRYFANVFEKLPKNGLFLIDCFGGSQCYAPIEEETDHDDFTYFWDQDSYDPITAQAQFHIHFQVKGGKRIDKVFSYDWRMWNIPELREILAEAGFEKTTVYWEGTTPDGGGDGDFKAVSVGEDCDSWIAYIAAERK